VAGRYYLHLGVNRHRNRNEVAFHAPHLLGFVVYGDQGATGLVVADHEMKIEMEPGAER
jgi:hypothetical protein